MYCAYCLSCTVSCYSHLNIFRLKLHLLSSDHWANIFTLLPTFTLAVIYLSAFFKTQIHVHVHVVSFLGEREAKNIIEVCWSVEYVLRYFKKHDHHTVSHIDAQN